MKDGWELKKLDDIFNVKSSKRVHKSDWRNKGVPFYRAREVVKLSRDGFVENELYISEKLYNEYALKTGVPEKDDIIISAVGTLGQCYLVNENDKFYFKDASVLWFQKKREIESKYIEYAFKSNLVLKQVLHKSMGATVGTLTITRARKIKIPIPPLEEQQQIVQILDQAFAKIDQAIANLKQNIQNAEDLFQSKLNQIFSQQGEGGVQSLPKGWEEKKLGEVCENLDRKRVPITKSKRESGEIPYYGASGIVDYVKDYLFDEELLLVSEDGANLLARTYPIAFSISGKTWVNNHAHVLRFKDQIDQKFIELYLNSISLEPYVSGMAQPKLNQKKLNSIKVPDVSKKEKEIIVKNILLVKENTNSLIEKYESKLKNLEELKKSLLEKAFSGELTSKGVEV